MGKSKFELNGATKVILNAAGNLKISGWEENGALASYDADELSCVVNEGIAKIDCDTDLTLIIPQNLSIQVVGCGGDLLLKNLHADLEIQLAGGDLTAVDIIGSITAGNIGGDADLKEISGNLVIASIVGDFSACKIDSDIKIGNVAGDLTLEQCNRNISAIAGGDASVYFTVSEERKVLLNAGGDIQAHFDGDPSGYFNTVSGSGTTEVQLLDERQLKGSSVNQFELGTGIGNYKFVAGGDIHICNKEACHSKKHLRIKGSTGEGFGQINIDFDGISGIDMDDLQQRINEKMEKVHQKTEEINARIEEKMHKHLQKMKERGGVFGEHVSRNSSTAKASDPVTEDEKKLILKMLQEKKISPEEAERLFESLEKNA